MDRLGKFVLEERLGAGASGEVWRALDTALDRRVALKILRSADPGEIERFEREARTAAKLDHPGIASVFEVGEADRRHFIAMRLVDGPTLKHWTGPRPELVRLLRDAALAVDHAHERGIVHRDLKPENLMVEQGRAIVTDFGLARTVEGSLTSAITGTPAFMPPEQARGERADARSDVYALGATLYERLTGRPPHAGPSLLETLRLIQEEEPLPPRRLDATIEPALESVVLVCLEKDPSRRYDSAAALAADLDCVLRGEAVLARPAGFVERARRAAGRRRAALLVVTVAIAVILLGTIGVGIAQWRRRTAEQDALRRLDASAATCLEAAIELRRAGNVDGMGRFSDELTALCSEVIRKMPHSPEPHYRLGLMFRARMKSAEALIAQEEALLRDPFHPGARFERGLLRVGLYEKKLDQQLQDGLMRLGEAALASGRGVVLPRITRVSLEDAEARRLRDGALADFAGLDHPLVPAMVAWLHDRDEEARALFRTAVALAPDAEMAYTWLGRLAWEVGDGDDARKWLTDGIARDRGYAPHWQHRGRLLYGVGAGGLAAGNNDPTLLDPSITDLRQACALQPDNAESWALLGLACSTSSTSRSAAGLDGGPSMREAFDACGEAIRLQPADHRAWLTRGRARYSHATLMDRRGGDAGRDYGAALSDTDEAIRRGSTNPDAWTLRGDIRGACAALLQRAGRDPTDLASLAERDYREAIRRDPSKDEPWSGLGMLHVNRGDALAARGNDPFAAYDDAAKAFDQAALLAPARDEPWYRLGCTHCQRATWLLGAGRDPAPAVEPGLAALAKALAIHPSRSMTHSVRGSLRIALAQWRMRERGDPASILADARLDMDRAVKADPRDADAWFNRANLCFWQGTSSPNDDAPLEEAIGDYGRALALHPLHTRAQIGRASAHGALGARQRARGGDPTAHYTAALEELRAVVRRVPDASDGWYYLGHTWWNLAVHRNLQGAEIVKEAREALAAWTEAVRLNAAYREKIAEPMELCRRAVKGK